MYIKKLIIGLCFVMFIFCSCATWQNSDSINETITKETIKENIENESDLYTVMQTTVVTSLDGIKKYSIQNEKILGVGYLKDSEKKKFFIT